MTAAADHSWISSQSASTETSDEFMTKCYSCHIAVTLSCLGICLVNFMFYFESNSPLVSGHLPFLLCPWSDVIPNSWLFSPVFPSPMCIKSLSSPVCVAKVFRLPCCVLKPWATVLYLALISIVLVLFIWVFVLLRRVILSLYFSG